MRYAIIAALLTSCAPAPYRCEFPVWVKVLDQVSADAECHALNLVDHEGRKVKDTAHVRGCAPAGAIITNGTESNMGHEMKHQVDRYCK